MFYYFKKQIIIFVVINTKRRYIILCIKIIHILFLLFKVKASTSWAIGLESEDRDKTGQDKQDCNINCCLKFFA